MTRDMDKIVFDSRLEVDNIYNALDDYLVWCDRHECGDAMIDDIKNLRNMLDAMSINW